MELCDNGHNEVCYETLTCPACDMIVATEEVESRLGERDDIIDELRSTIKELEFENSKLDSRIRELIKELESR